MCIMYVWLYNDTDINPQIDRLNTDRRIKESIKRKNNILQTTPDEAKIYELMPFI